MYKDSPTGGMRWVAPVVVLRRHNGGPRWSGGGGNPRERESDSRERERESMKYLNRYFLSLVFIENRNLYRKTQTVLL